MITPRQYSTSDLEAAVRRELDRRDREPAYLLGHPSEIHRVAGHAHHDELVRVDGQDVRLPAITAADVGRSLSIANGSATVQSTVTCAPGDTVDHGDSATVVVSHVAQFVAHKVGLWLTAGGSSESASGGDAEPFWQWNGSDTSQFNGIVEGSAVSSSSLSTAVVGGRTWVEFTATAPGNVGSNAMYRCAVAPISVTPPSPNYKITYDMMCSDFGGGYLCQGAVARWASSSHSGDFYFEAINGGNIWIGLVSGGALNASQYRSEVDVATYALTTDMQRSEFSVSDESLLYTRCLGCDHGMVDTGAALTAAGQPGILAGITGGIGTKTIKALFSNIQCWAV